MTAVPVAEHMTAAKFLDLPVPERGRPWNLVNGEVIVNDPTALHGEVVEELQFALGAWTRAEPGRGKVAVPLDVKVDDRKVFAPDLISAELRPGSARVQAPSAN